VKKFETFKEWEAEALRQDCSVYRVRIGAGGLTLYHAYRPNEGTIGVWNGTNQTGFMSEVIRPETLPLKTCRKCGHPILAGHANNCWPQKRAVKK
jgi:hypothetical protein